jgi:hypothetical protein
MGIGVVLLGIAVGMGIGCATPGPVPVVAPAVALVEWQFPIGADADGVRAHPRQQALTTDPRHVAMRPAFFPALSEENQAESERMIGKLSKSRLAGLDALLAAHPEVVLVTATPHISGNHDSVELLAERPSILATRRVPNVVLAGCVAFYEDGVEADRAGLPLGSAENPSASRHAGSWRRRPRCSPGSRR